MSHSVLKSKWVHTITLLVLLTAAVLVSYQYFLKPPYWPKLLMTFDYYRYFGPQAHYMDIAVHNGGFPLWNPLSLCGMPFAANPQTAAFYPPQIVRSLLTFDPTPYKTHVGLLILVALHLVFAGAGAYTLARHYGLSRPASMAAAIIFMLSPHIVRRTLEQWVLVAVASYFPWLVLMVSRALNETSWRTRAPYILTSGLLLGLQILAGFPQLTFYTVLALIAFVILHRLVHVPITLRMPKTLAREFAVDTVTVAALCIVAAMVAAALLLPAAELATRSVRIEGSGHTVVPFKQDLSPSHLLACLLVYPGASYVETGCRGAGLIALLLALIGLTHKQWRNSLLYAIFLAVLTDFTLGPPYPLGRLVQAIDFCQFSSPWRAGALTGLPLAILAAFGVDASVARLKNWRWTLLRSLAVLAVGAYMLTYLNNWLGPHKWFEVSQAVIYFPAIAVAVLIIAPWFNKRRFFGTVMAALVFCEIATWHQGYFPFFLKRSGYKMPMELLKNDGVLSRDNARGTDERPNLLMYAMRPVMNGYEPLRLKESSSIIEPERSKRKSYTRQVPEKSVTTDSNYANLFLKRSFWLSSEYIEGEIPPENALFPPTSVVYLKNPGELPVSKGTPRFSSVSAAAERIDLGGPELMDRLITYSEQNGGRLPLPWLRNDDRHAAVCLDYTLTGQIDLNVEFTGGGSSENGRRYILFGRNNERGILEIPLPQITAANAALKWKDLIPNTSFTITSAFLLADNADEGRLIGIVERNPNSAEVEVRDLPQSRILTFVDAMYPGWTACVDSQRVPLMKANGAFKAVVVPPGTHRVRFEFRPIKTYAGIAISLTSTAAMLIYLMAKRIRKDQRARDVD